jgi:ATP/maltotriose-dependent transcriptional regulator MalT
LHERTEGWAAGLRLAALSLAGHPDPDRFAAEFSGSERTVADYLLTGASGGERILQDLDRGGYPQALASFGLADELAAELVRPNTSVTSMRARMVQALVLAGSVPGVRQVWMVTALLREAAARDTLGGRAAASRALERALDIADSTGILLPFLLDPAPARLEWHRRNGTAHSALAAQILDLLAPPAPRTLQAAAGIDKLIQPLTGSELCILRYLPTRLTAQEIASELSLSVHTVTTHMRHLYAKLGVHRRRQAVERARGLGLLAPIPRGS